MINRNELRIGNLVEEKVLGYCKVDTILRKTAQVSKDESQSYSIDIKNLLPIPLTPELLIKCGLEEANFKNQLRFCGEFLIDNTDGSFDLIIGDNEISLATVKYLHQLQNLFFSLTNTELKIEL